MNENEAGKAIVTRPEQTPRVPVAWESRGPVPQTVEDTYRIAKVFEAAGICRNTLKCVEHYMIVIWAGQAIGVPPVQAVQGIMLVNDRPCIWGDLGMALVHRSGLLRDFKEWFEGDGDTLTAFCQMRRDGHDEPKIVTFSMEQAKRAGLSGRDTYRKFDRRMLMWRSRYFLIRDLFPDLLMGLDISEIAHEPADRFDGSKARGGDPDGARSRLLAAPDPIQTGEPSATEKEAAAPSSGAAPSEEAGAVRGDGAHSPPAPPPGPASPPPTSRPPATVATARVPPAVRLAARARLADQGYPRPSDGLLDGLCRWALSQSPLSPQAMEALKDPLRNWKQVIREIEDALPDQCPLTATPEPVGKSVDHMLIA